MNRLLAAVLATTYAHRVTAFRPLPDGGRKQVCEDRPCALSRSALVTSPEPPAPAYFIPEGRYRLSLFTRPELSFQLGDLLEVRDGGGRVFRGRASDSFYYPTHCVTVLEVAEALEPEEEPDPGEADGQDSRETEG